MAISQTAHRNHDALFPDHTSMLAITDPELVEIFDNWAFDELIEDAPLEARLRLMVQLSSLIACQSVAEFRIMLGAALQVGVTPVEIKELLYQAIPYTGMARVFDFLLATNDVFNGRNITLPVEGQSTTTPETRRAKGLEVQKQLFGQQIEQMHLGSPKDQWHIQKYLSDNCFGDYLTRRGLDLKTRELLTLSMLASLGGCEGQLAAHVKGNLAIGNDRKVMIAVVTHLLPFIGYPRALNALRVITEGSPADGT
jgi:4-carboxymuconolactone decarboxylase